MKFRQYVCLIFSLLILSEIVSSAFMLRLYNITSIFSLINIRKEILAVSGILLLAGFAVFMMLSNKKKITIRIRHLWIFTTILYITGSWMFVNRNDGIDKINTGIYIVSLIVIYYAIRSLQEKKVFILLGAFYSLYLFHLIIALLHLTELLPTSSPYAFKSTFENTGDVANFIAAIIPLNLALIFHHINKIKNASVKSRAKLVYTFLPIASLAIGIILLILSNARIAWLACIVSLISFLLIYLSAFLHTLNTRIKAGMIVSGLLITLMSVCGLLSFKTGSTKGRLLIYDVCFTMVRENPVSGIGTGRFKIDYNNAQATYLKTHPLLEQFADNTYAAFNEYLQVLVELGMIGGVLMIAFMVMLYFGAKHITILNKKNNDLTIYIGSIASLIAISVCSLASYPCQNVLIALIAITNASLLITKGNPAGSTLANIQLNRGLQIALSVLLLTGSIYMARFKTGELLSYYKWENAVTLAERNKKEEANNIYGQIADNLKGCGSFLFNYGAQSAFNGDFTKSQRLLLESTRYYTHSDQYAFLGDNYTELNLYKEAEQNYLHAIYMVPSKVYPKYRLVRLYIKCNRVPEALVMARKIIETPLKGTNYIAFEIKEEMKKLILNHQPSN